MSDNSSEGVVKRGLLQPLMGMLGYVQRDTVEKEKKALAIDIMSVNSRIAYGVLGQQAAMEKGFKKPGKVTFQALRKIAAYDAIIRICVNVIKKEVSQSEWDIVPRKGTKPNQDNINRARKLFTLLNSNGENLRVLLDRVLEDLLVLDAGVIEKVFNAKGELVELNSVDGATIRPVYNEYGEMDVDKAYVQVMNEKVVAEFKLNEIIYIMQNPQNDVNLFGYGLSPIESILLSVQASLNADLYNAQTFSKDNIPPGMLDLGNMSNEQGQQFKAIWDATVIDNTQKLKMVWGSDNPKKYIPFQQNNKDMQFIEYIDWLSRLKLATYGLTSQDANITQDVNRATAEVQASITQSRGVRTIKRLIEEYFNREIMLPSGFENELFKFSETVSLEQKRKQADIDKIYLDTSVISPTEVAEREGFDTPEIFDEDEESEMTDSKVDNMTGEDDVLSEKQVKNKNYYRPLYDN